MARLSSLFARLGLFTAKPEAIDVFDLRLTRIGSREARARKQGVTFRSQPSLPADAALS